MSAITPDLFIRFQFYSSIKTAVPKRRITQLLQRLIHSLDFHFIHRVIRYHLKCFVVPPYMTATTPDPFIRFPFYSHNYKVSLEMFCAPFSPGNTSSQRAGWWWPPSCTDCGHCRPALNCWSGSCCWSPSGWRLPCCWCR